MYVDNGLLFRQCKDNIGNRKWAQLVVPQILRNEVLGAPHNGIADGHLGEDKTLGKLKEHFNWLGYTEDAHSWCQTCTVCAARKSSAPRNRAKLVNVSSGYPLQSVAMDILGSLPESNKKNLFWLSVTPVLAYNKVAPCT